MARLPATIDGSTGKSLPTPRTRLRLKSIDDIACELARVYRSMKAGQLVSQDATRRAYVLSMMAKVLESGEMARRVAELEQRLGVR